MDGLVRFMMRYAILGENGRDTGGRSHRFLNAKKAVWIAFNGKLKLLWSSTCPYCGAEIGKSGRSNLARHLTAGNSCSAKFKEDVKRAIEVFNILSLASKVSKLIVRKRRKKRVTTGNRMVVVTFKVDRGLLELLNAYAKTHKMTRSRAIRMAICNLLESGGISDAHKVCSRPNS